MKRRWILTSVAVLAVAGAAAAFTMGSLASIDNAAKTERELDLRLVILVNRLQLTPEQLTAVKERLEEVVEKGKAIEAKRTAFAQELLTFAGDEAALDARLAAFQAEMTGLRRDLTVTARENLEELKGILTIRQGEILRDALPDWPLLGSDEGVASIQGSVTVGIGQGAGIERWGFDVLPSVPQTGAMTMRGQALVERIGPMLERMAEKAPKVAQVLPRLQALQGERSETEATIQAEGASRKILQRLEDLLYILNQRATLRAA